jgi:hypothetical protein
VGKDLMTRRRWKNAIARLAMACCMTQLPLAALLLEGCSDAHNTTAGTAAVGTDVQADLRSELSKLTADVDDLATAVAALGPGDTTRTDDSEAHLTVRSLRPLDLEVEDADAIGDHIRELRREVGSWQQQARTLADEPETQAGEVTRQVNDLKGDIATARERIGTIEDEIDHMSGRG